MSNPGTKLRLFIVFQWVCYIIFFSALLTVFFGEPEKERLAVVENVVSTTRLPVPIYNILNLCIALSFVVSSIGLLFFGRWARPTYLVSVLLFLGLVGFFGPIPQFPPNMPRWIVMLGGFGSISIGIIISLVYFSDVRDLFKKRTRSPSNSDENG